MKQVVFISKLALIALFAMVSMYFYSKTVEAAPCTCCYTSVSGCSIKNGKCTLSTGSVCINGNTSGSSCNHTRVGVSISHGCQSNTCYYYGKTDYHNACSYSGTPPPPPPSCTNKCPCTPGSKSSPWVEGTAPADYIASCIDTTTCSEKKGDCSNCSGTRRWYLPNRPTSPPPLPQSVSYCINGACTVLSTNPSAPTSLSIPTSADVVKFRVSPGTLPTGARAWRFNYQLDNLADGLNCGTTGSNGNPYDRCQSNETTVDSSWSYGDMLSPSRSNGGNYSIRYFNGVLKSCTNDILYETSGLTAYLTFNTPPEVVSYTSAVSLSGTETDADNGTERGTTCSDNNPYEFSIRYRDVDGASTLNRVGFWIDNVGPAGSQMMDSIHGMLFRNGSNWDLKGYTCTGAGTGCSWGVNGGVYPGVNTENRHLCSVNSGWSDVLATNALCSGNSVVGSWTVKNIQYPNSTDVVVTYKVWIDKNLGSTSPDGSIRIYGLTHDGVVNSGWVQRGTHTLDFTPPMVSFVSPPTVTGSNSIRLDWSVSDALSGVAGIHGRARLVEPGVVNGPINNTTSGVNDYTLEPQDSRPLWTVLNPTSRSENIDLRSNEGGVIGFSAHAWDAACNYAESPVTSLNHNEPWAATKGGLLYSQSGINLNTRTVSDPGNYLTRNNPLWQSPFRFKIDNPATVTSAGTILGTAANDIASSTEFQSVNTGGLGFGSYTSFPSLGFGLSGVADRKNNKPVYADLLDKVNTGLGEKTSVTELALSTINTQVLPTSSSLINCGAEFERCVYTRNGNLTVISMDSTPFTCDKPTVFLINGVITIGTDIVKSTEPLAGCMFISSNNIVVLSGIDHPNVATCSSANITDETVCYPPYDTIQAFLMADNQIILRDNPETLLNEGLRVHGSMVAFGATDSPAVKWERSLKLASNPRFPALVVHYDPVYLGIAKSIFEFKYDAYVQDVGFKP